MIDECDLCAEVASGARRGVAARAGTEDDEIVL